MPTVPVPSGTNLALLVGTLSRPPEPRSLSSGDTVLALELTVRPDGAAAESVPLAWFAPPPEAVGWAVGEELLVTGRIRRRFFRAAGITQSRTEVVVTDAVPTRRSVAGRKAVVAALAAVGAKL